MLIALLLLNILPLVLLIAGYIYAKRRFEQVTGEFVNLYSSFTTKKDETTPSPLETFIDGASQIMVNRLLTTMSAQQMANKSHITRQANAIAEDMIQDDAGSVNPLLGMFLNQYPSVRKRLAKNPAALQAILPMLSNLGAAGGHDHGSNGGGNIARRIKNDI